MLKFRQMHWTLPMQ